MPIRRLTACFAPLALALACPANAQTTVPHLIPIPREINAAAPQPIPQGIRITCATCFTDHDDEFTAQDLTQALTARCISLSGPYTVTLVRAAALAGLPPEAQPEGYTIASTPTGISLTAASGAGLYYAAQTLKQLILNDGAKAVVQAASVRDWPAMKYRGVHDDLSRGPVPTLEFQEQLIRTLSAYKINLYSPYFEHTQQYASNPLFGPPGESLSAADARTLVAYAAQYQRHHRARAGGLRPSPPRLSLGAVPAACRNPARRCPSHPASPAPSPSSTRCSPSSPASILGHSCISARMRPRTWALARPSLTSTAAAWAPSTSTSCRRSSPACSRCIAASSSGATSPRPSSRAAIHTASPGPTVSIRRFSTSSPQTSKKRPSPVAWQYNPEPKGFAKFLAPFTAAGFETWVSPGVNNWGRVWPNYGDALLNIRDFVAEGQRQHSTGALNTIWYDDGEALANSNWYGLLFGAAASWQHGTSSIEAFEQSYGQIFHGDTTGALNQAQIELMQCPQHPALSQGRGRLRRSLLDRPVIPGRPHPRRPDPPGHPRPSPPRRSCHHAHRSGPRRLPRSPQRVPHLSASSAMSGSPYKPNHPPQPRRHRRHGTRCPPTRLHRPQNSS